MIRRALGSPIYIHGDGWKGNLSSRSCNIRWKIIGKTHNGTAHIVGFRDGARRWLFPQSVLMIDNVRNDHYREIQIHPWEIQKPPKQQKII